MAAQRIVVTSPWKLGLFVFLLVVGAGFGLIYAWISLFGGELRLDDSAWLQNFYMVCGAVAGLGLVGYLAVITSARPLDGVMRGGKRREMLLRKFGHIENPTELDPDDFAHEPALQTALVRWQDDSTMAASAGSLRQAIAHLAARVEGIAPGDELSARDGDIELGQLVNAINAQLRSAPSPELATPTVDLAAPAAPAPSAVDPSAQKAWRSVGSALLRRQGELMQLVSMIRSAGQQLGGGSADGGSRADELGGQSAARLAELREKLEALAEESNRLAIQAALQVSRLGTDSTELVQVTEAIRSVSTRYQRLVPDLRLCENDIQTLRADGQSANGGANARVATALENGAGGLHEIADDIHRQIHHLSNVLSVTLDQPSEAVSPLTMDVSVPQPAPSAAVDIPPIVADVPQPEPAMDDDVMEMDALGGQAIEVEDDVMEMDALGGREVEVEAEDDVMELDALGGRELDGAGEPIYDLAEFGGVEL